MTISDEAVEAVAQLIYRSSGRHRVMTYDEARANCHAEALVLLEAAAPYMHDKAAETRLLAIAWEEGALSAITNTSTRLTNPYRSQA
jgi:hypothetical protein